MTPANWCARTPRADWRIRFATTSRCCESKRPGDPAISDERALVCRRAGEHSMSDDLDGWEAEFVLAADRLDTPDVVAAADPGDMLRQVASAAAQVRTAVRSCAETDLSAFTPDTRPRAILVAGMGGSGTAGDILSAICGTGSPVLLETV